MRTIHEGHSPCDSHVCVGKYHVCLWKGLLRDEVRVWVDVRPALGGLIGRKAVWRGRGPDLMEEVVRVVGLGVVAAGEL